MSFQPCLPSRWGLLLDKTFANPLARNRLIVVLQCCCGSVNSGRWGDSLVDRFPFSHSLPCCRVRVTVERMWRPTGGCFPFPGVLSFAFPVAFLSQVSGELPSPYQSSMDASSPSDVPSSGASSSSQPSTAAAVLRALASGSASVRPSLRGTGVSKEIDNLLETQRQVRAKRAQVTKDLKNAQRRRQMLKHKARLLTAPDLASVLVLRQEEEETKTSTTKRRRSSQPGQGAGKHSVNEDRTEEGPESDASAEDDHAPELAAEITKESREEERAAA